MAVILGRRDNPHELKCWPDSFNAIWYSGKRSEVRRDDRGGFEAGQFLRLREWDPATKAYTCQLLLVQIMHVERGLQVGIQEGFVVLTIHPVEVT